MLGNGKRAACSHDCDRCRALNAEQESADAELSIVVDVRNPSRMAARLGEERTFTAPVTDGGVTASLEETRRSVIREAAQERRFRDRIREAIS